MIPDDGLDDHDDELKCASCRAVARIYKYIIYIQEKIVEEEFFRVHHVLRHTRQRARK